MKFCRDCGSKINQKAEICPSCGVRQQSAPITVDKNKYVAAILAFFLGAFGVHRFYLGSWGTGIVYLLLCWTGIPWIFSLFEFLYLICISKSKFEQNYSS